MLIDGIVTGVITLAACAGCAYQILSLGMPEPSPWFVGVASLGLGRYFGIGRKMR